MKEITLKKKDAFLYLQDINSRWSDNDTYGHINNVMYYSYFDTAVNKYLIDHGGLDIHKDAIVAYVVHSSCNYIKPISFPSTLQVGVSVHKIGNSSVTYELSVFTKDSDLVHVYGQFVHVFVSKEENKPVPIPHRIRIALEKLWVAK